MVSAFPNFWSHCIVMTKRVAIIFQFTIQFMAIKVCLLFCCDMYLAESQCDEIFVANTMFTPKIK